MYFCRHHALTCISFKYNSCSNKIVICRQKLIQLTERKAKAYHSVKYIVFLFVNVADENVYVRENVRNEKKTKQTFFTIVLI